MIDFGDIGPRVRPAEHRNKAAEEMRARLNALPAECCTTFTSGLPMQMREALAVVVRANKAAGGPCIVHRSDIANALGITPDGGERILGRLVEIGAVESIPRLMQSPLLRAVPDALRSAPPSPARKADPGPAAPEQRRRPSSITDPRLKAGLVGLRNHEEPSKTNLLAGVVGASR